MVHQTAASAIPPVGSPREPGARRLALAGVVLLLSGVAGAVSEIPQWGACLDELYGPACVAGQEHHLYSSVLPGPAWIGEPWAVLLHGAALLGIAAAVALVTAGRLDRVWRALVVYPTACVGLLTLIPAVIGQGLAINVAVEWAWIMAVPLVFLLACLWSGPGGSRPASRWILVLLALLALTSTLPQVFIGIGITGHHDTPPGYGLVQAVPIAALGIAALGGAAVRLVPWIRRSG